MRGWALAVMGCVLAAAGAGRTVRPGRTVEPPAGAVDSSFDLAGTVRVEESGRPVPGTLVVVQAEESRAEWRTGTDSAGRYRFAALPRGAYTVAARHVGYYQERRELWVVCYLGFGMGPPACDSTHQRLDFGLRERPAL